MDSFGILTYFGRLFCHSCAACPEQSRRSDSSAEFSGPGRPARRRIQQRGLWRIG